MYHKMAFTICMVVCICQSQRKMFTVLILALSTIDVPLILEPAHISSIFSAPLKSKYSYYDDHGKKDTELIRLLSTFWLA